ncbi:unnamed protein product, partial [Phaeothamnion confervicola]
MVEDLRRARDRHGVPLRFPWDMAVLRTTLPAQRLLTAITMEPPPFPERFLEPVSRQLWLRIWSRREDVAADASLRAACAAAGVPGTDADRLLEAAAAAPAKDMLRRTTDEAVARGAFGAPAIFVSKRIGEEKWHHFFGSDRFEDIAALIGRPWLGP